MNENQTWVIGFLVGLLVVAIAFFVIYAVKTRNNQKAQYDERQVLARNSAFKFAFFTILIYSAVCVCLDMLDVKWATLTTLLYIGIMVSITVFAIICITKDAYNGYNQSSLSSIIFIAFVGVLNLVVFILNVFEGESFFTDGMLNEHIINLCIAVMFLAVTATQLIKNRMNKKAAEDE